MVNNQFLVVVKARGHLMSTIVKELSDIQDLILSSIHLMLIKILRVQMKEQPVMITLSLSKPDRWGQQGFMYQSKGLNVKAVLILIQSSDFLLNQQQGHHLLLPVTNIKITS